MNDTITINNQTYTIGIDFANGDVAAPAFTFVNNTSTGFYIDHNTSMSFSIGNPHSKIDDIYDLFFAGKTIKEHSDEYLRVIMNLPNMNQCQLDAIETLEFFRRQFFPEPDEK